MPSKFNAFHRVITTMTHNGLIFSSDTVKLHSSRRVIAPLAAAAGALMLAGCAALSVGSSSSFSCPGMPGVMCQTPQQVYAQTSGSAMPPNVFPSGGGATGGAVAPPQGAATASGVPMANLPATGNPMLQPVTGAPMPLREPSRVMRVWIAPWIEKKTDHLHWPTYVFAEVQPRKWTVGKPDFGGMRAGMPLFVRPSAAQAPLGSQPTASAAHVPVANPGVAGSGASAPERQTQPVLAPSGAGQDNFQQPF